MRFFTAFCNHWHCTCAMVLSLLCNHWQFLLRFSAMAKQNQNPKKQTNQETKKKNKTKQTKNPKWQDPTLCHYSPPWGVQSCCFFCCCFLVSWFFVFVFLVSWFFGFLFSGLLLVFWRAKDLDLTLCQFSHFRGCKLAFGWFYYLLLACGSSRKPCKKLWQNAGITGGSLGGLGHN